MEHRHRGMQERWDSHLASSLPEKLCYCRCGAYINMQQARKPVWNTLQCYDWVQSTSDGLGTCCLVALARRPLAHPPALQTVFAAMCSGNPPAPANSVFACSSPAEVGSVCNATCAVGYRGSPSATCLATGNYSAVTGGCERIGELGIAYKYSMAANMVSLYLSTKGPRATLAKASCQLHAACKSSLQVGSVPACAG